VQCCRQRRRRLTGSVAAAIPEMTRRGFVLPRAFAFGSYSKSTIEIPE
jgi:hypothetical protein